MAGDLRGVGCEWEGVAVTAEAALLHAIRLHPAEDTPRLIYADWLDENAEPGNSCGRCRGRGETVAHWQSTSDTWGSVDRCCDCDGTGRVSDGRRERAEFIRIQIRIAGLRAACGCGGYTALRGGGQHHNGPCDVGRERDEQPDGTSRPAMLRARENALWREWSRRWFGWGTGTDTFGSALTPNEVDPRIRRGFVAEVRMTLAAFMDAAKGLFSVHPIDTVVLTDREPAAVGGDIRPRYTWTTREIALVAAQAWVLPWVLWSRVREQTSRSPPPVFMEFASRGAALATLSAVCVAYGRGLAGLPPLFE